MATQLVKKIKKATQSCAVSTRNIEYGLKPYLIFQYGTNSIFTAGDGRPPEIYGTKDDGSLLAFATQYRNRAVTTWNPRLLDGIPSGWIAKSKKAIQVKVV